MYLNKNVKKTFEILRSEITFLMDLYLGKFLTQFKIQAKVAVVHYIFFLIHHIWDKL